MKNDKKGDQPVILVIGDLMVDHYIWGVCTRISPEAPVQVVNVKKETEHLGGALNVINNLVSLGAKVYASGIIGNDAAGKNSLAHLSEIGVDTMGIVIDVQRPTTLKSRVLASNHQIIRIDREDASPISATTAEYIIEFVKSNLSLFDIILLSDYAKGVLTPFVCEEVIKLAKENRIKVLVDPKGNDYSKYYGAHLITPNKKETIQATGIELSNEEALAEAGEKLRKVVGLDKVVMTLGEDGIALYDNKLNVFPTMAKQVYDVTGAGDTVLAALGYSLSIDHSIEDACKFANAAAAVVIGKVGSATATKEEIQTYLYNQISSKRQKIIQQSELNNLIDSLNIEGKKIVFTNGCFDILHAGHVSYLQKARKLGDVLILGLNSDESVRKLKGADRPINNEIDRAVVLAGLDSVDFIIVFTEETPYELIKKIKPQILVKGKDYQDKEVVGSDIADKVILIDFIEGKSTTKILEKIGKVI